MSQSLHPEGERERERESEKVSEKDREGYYWNRHGPDKDRETKVQTER